MTTNQVENILKNTDYVRVGGSPEELKAAEFLAEQCRTLGAETVIESFPVQMAEIDKAILKINGKEIECKAFKNCGSGHVKAPFYYMPNNDKASLVGAKDKIVLIDTGVGYFGYKDLVDNGAAGIICFNGNVAFDDKDVDQRELRERMAKELKKIPIVNVNVKDAVDIVRSQPQDAEIEIEQRESIGESHNVIATIPGKYDDYIVLSAHYDSVFLSHGLYDNMTGCIALIGILDDMIKTAPNNYGLKFIFTGSEERGLLGSKAYVRDHKDELEKIVLDINVDMIGSIMGKFIACATAEDKLVAYISYIALEQGWGIAPRQGVYSSDSTPFADSGIPSVSFARMGATNVTPYHNRFDRAEELSVVQIIKDISFISDFTSRMANAVQCPVAREIPDNMKTEIEYYLSRKRRP